MKSKTKTYALSIIATLAVGGLSALLTRNNMDVYETINTPSVAPPAILFPIVWTVLYILMGISFANVLIKGHEEGINTQPATRSYVIQLVVNFFWSIIFFNLRNFLFSFVWILLLWVLIILMIKEFVKISKVSGYLNIPYFLWVTFATYLNYMIYILN